MHLLHQDLKGWRGQHSVSCMLASPSKNAGGLIPGATFNLVSTRVRSFKSHPKIRKLKTLWNEMWLVVGPHCPAALLMLERRRAVSEHSCFSPRAVLKSPKYTFLLLLLLLSFLAITVSGQQRCFVLLFFCTGNSGALEHRHSFYGEKWKCRSYAFYF